MTPEHFAALKADFLAHLAERPRLYRQQLFGGSQPEHRVGVQVITEFAWHSQFIRTLLCRPTAAELAAFAAEYTIIDLPSFRADPAEWGRVRQGGVISAVAVGHRQAALAVMCRG